MPLAAWRPPRPRQAASGFSDVKRLASLKLLGPTFECVFPGAALRPAFPPTHFAESGAGSGAHALRSANAASDHAPPGTAG